MQVGHNLQPMFYLLVTEPQQKPHVKLSFIFNLSETRLQEIWAVLWSHLFTAPFLSPYVLSPTFFLPSQSPIPVSVQYYELVQSHYFCTGTQAHISGMHSRSKFYQLTPTHFQCISCPGKQWAAVSTFLIEIPRAQNLPPFRLPNSPKHPLLMYTVQWNV